MDPIRNFSVEIVVLTGDEDGLDDDAISFDAASMVELPEHQSVTEEQLEVLTKQVASTISDFLKSIYQDAAITTCT